MTDLALVAALEKRMFNAWPAVETLVLDDWLLRWAHGYSKRANSASALVAGADADDALIEAIEERCHNWRHRVCFRLTPLAAPTLDARLAARGYEQIERSCVMLAPLNPGFTADPRVSFAPAPPDGWLVANAAAYGGDRADHRALSAIVSRIRMPAAFASLALGAAIVAWGIAVAERGYVALQDIVVDPAQRGKGLGLVLVTSLMAWGRSQGATQAYLQVRDTNAVARRLYFDLGFTDAYIYTHRVKG
jgi:ribosomal protein S18 acetylase RimI-like enzyme